MKIVDTITELCARHAEVYRRVNDAYSFWSAAYGNLTTRDFLNRLIALPETGERAREMAEFLIRNPTRWK